MSTGTRIVVLGGGPAGLAAAHYARSAGFDVDLYEAGTEVGGNCRTIRFGEHRVDTGAHRLHDRDPETTALARRLLGDNLMAVDAPSQIYHGGTLIDFPLAPLDLLRRLPLRTIAAIVRENVALRFRRRRDHASFGEIARATYGRTLASIALLGYSRKLWGRDPDELLPSVAGARLARLDLRTFLLETIRGRSSARRHLDGAFLYPRFGIGQLFDALGASLGNAIHTDCAVTRIVHDEQRVTSIEVEGRSVPAQHVINTLPLGITARLLDPSPPESIIDAARSLRFRHLRLCVLVVRRPRFSRNASIYVPDESVPFTRIYESKNRSAAMGTDAASAIVLEVPCEPDDRLWSVDFDSFARENIDALCSISDLRTDEVTEAHEVVVPNAYPVLELSSVQHVEHVRSYLASLPNMTMVGRNASFEYSSIHDLFRAAREAVRDLPRS